MPAMQMRRGGKAQCAWASITEPMRSIPNLTDRPVRESEEVADGIGMDYAAEGRIVGIETLDASKRTDDPSVLQEFSFELPKVG